MLESQQITNFQQVILEHYHQQQRPLPWRKPELDGNFDPYKIMVSEIMLQQTQVPRVIEKYHQFLTVFPTVHVLASVSLAEVLQVWQGLGYNRRGRFLREAAIQIVEQYNGVIPQKTEELMKLSGIGRNTANAILAYAYNQPVSYVETNIRTVYLHHFFANSEAVDDAIILKLVEQTIWLESPREWYWALMDYGTYIKKQHGNPNVRSKHYVKQSKFEGSSRQLRGMLLRELAEQEISVSSMKERLSDPRLQEVIDGLVKDYMIIEQNGMLRIAE